MSSHEGRSVYEFGDFRLDAGQRQLLLKANGQVLPLVSRAFDTLLYLVEHPGELVSKTALMQAVWPTTVVEENNLSQSIAAIRRTLGERPGEHKYIVTIPGRGFRFVAPVETPLAGAAPADAPAPRGTVAPTGSWRGWLAAALAVLVLGGGALGYQLRTPSDAGTTAHTLAILPFKPVDPADSDPSLQYGMTDTLISRLRELDGVSVQPFSSVRRFGNPDQDALVAARVLGVASVLDGTIQRSGDRLRLTATLFDVQSGRQLWSEQLHEDFTDIFAVQDAIAARITDALAVRLSGAEHRRLTHRYTDDAEAYQHYVNGWFQRSRTDADGYLRSIDFFEQAIARDPDYPLPYVGLADSYTMLAVFGVMAPMDAFPSALAAAQRALEIDSGLGEAHASLAHIRLQYEGDFEAAERGYQRAISIAPRYAIVHMWYGLLLAWSGRFDESLARLQYAQQLEPLQLGTSANIGMILYFSRRYDEAIDWLLKLLDAEPGMDHARSFLGRAYLRKGDYDAAIREFAQRSSPTVSSQSDLASAYALAGRRQEALAELDRLLALSRERYVSSYDIAAIHVALGDADAAFEALDRAVQERAQPLGHVWMDPAFDAVREDPRMTQLLARLDDRATATADGFQRR